MSRARSSIWGFFLIVLPCTAACGGGSSSPATALAPGAPAPPLRSVASVDQVMDAIIIPSSQRVFDAVVYVNGQLEQSPKSDDDWFGVQMSALAVAEAGNLLMLPPRAEDNDEWMAAAAGLIAQGERMLAAIDRRNTQEVFDVGADMYEACVRCHRQYMPGVKESYK